MCRVNKHSSCTNTVKKTKIITVLFSVLALDCEVVTLDREFLHEENVVIISHQMWIGKISQLAYKVMRAIACYC